MQNSLDTVKQMASFCSLFFFFLSSKQDDDVAFLTSRINMCHVAVNKAVVTELDDMMLLKVEPSIKGQNENYYKNIKG